MNNGEEITYFEILTAAYFFHASKYRENINIIDKNPRNIFKIVRALGKNLFVEILDFIFSYNGLATINFLIQFNV
mgnify:CR=1 FL=1